MCVAVGRVIGSACGVDWRGDGSKLHGLLVAWSSTWAQVCSPGAPRLITVTFALRSPLQAEDFSERPRELRHSRQLH